MRGSDSRSRRPGIITGLVVFAIAVGLYLISLHNYLLFHSLAELFSILVAGSVFILAHASQRLHRDSFVLFIGTALAACGFIDLLHTLAYAGMGVFPDAGPNLPTQLWVAARYLQAASLLAIPWVIQREPRPRLIYLSYAIAGFSLLAAIFGGFFPVSYLEGSGLTPFKKISEYVISTSFIASAWLLNHWKRRLDEEVVRWLTIAALVSVGSELAFTLYLNVYGLANAVGHLLKIAAFYAIYRAVVLVGVSRPHDLLFRRLRESEESFESIVQQSEEGIMVIDEAGKLRFANPTLQRWGGETLLPDRHTLKTLADSRAPIDVPLSTPAEAQGIGELVVARTLWQGEPAYLVTVRDMTARRRAEEALREREQQLLQAQRLEMVGRLAGGVAHNFNNLLTAISGLTQLAMEDIGPDSGTYKYLQETLGASRRAAALTRQLLAFSRRQLLNPQVINLNELIHNLTGLLSRLVAENIKWEQRLAPDLGAVKVDPGQIEQVLINLVMNARDAMPEGGTLTIETQRLTLDEKEADKHPGIPHGEYALLSVKDTGTGMSEEVKAHLFEPFFTTKGRDQGTGLGLASVHGIVEQHKGHIRVYSQLGRGTTFQIYLPCIAQPAQTATSKERPLLPCGTETVLIVEDEHNVRESVAAMLRNLGYTVLEAADGAAAIELCQTHDRELDLLLTDVVLPSLSGAQVAERLRLLCPTLPVLYMSAYPLDAFVRHGVLDKDIELLEKPFSVDILAQRVRAILDQSKASYVDGHASKS
ncbi:MAG: response regulator [Chloroflexi bacterium]|nr:response regulator [Chloroflexota bacterium]